LGVPVIVGALVLAGGAATAAPAQTPIAAITIPKLISIRRVFTVEILSSGLRLVNEETKRLGAGLTDS
jgi:hypothetical protein